MQKPTLLLEVEAALDAAEKTKAELEAFNEAHPNLGTELAAQTARLAHIKEALKWIPNMPMSLGVLVALSDAHTYQEEFLAPLLKLRDEREALAAEAHEAGRAYVFASHKWDSSAERLDYLMGLGLAALNRPSPPGAGT